MSKTNKAWRKRNPEKARAHWMVAEAIQRGYLVKLPCEVCGNKKVHGHHDDYSKPLEVRWLCHIHHEETHHNKKIISGKKPKITPVYTYHKKFQPAPEREKLIEIAKELREIGKSYQEIADKLHKNKGLIYKWINPKPEYR